MWRFWQALPPKGKVGMFFGGLYDEAIADRVHGRTRGADFERGLIEIVRFERMLVDEGALVVEALAAPDEEGAAASLREARVEPGHGVAGHQAGLESPPELFPFSRGQRARAPRHQHRGGSLDGRRGHRRPVPQPDGRRGAARRDESEARPGPTSGAAARAAAATRGDRRAKRPRRARPLEVADHAAVRQEAPAPSGRLNALSRHKRFKDIAVVHRLRGQRRGRQGGRDPSGDPRARRALLRRRAHRGAHRGGARAAVSLAVLAARARSRATSRSSIAAGTGASSSSASKGSPRSPTGCAPTARSSSSKRRSSRSGIVVVKFWLAIGQDEQLARFRAREKTPFKRFKITPDDWRNRKKWPAYERAVCDMVDRTSTDVAPWHLIEANDKKWARVRVLETIGDSIENALRR